jgi:YXWGXW repeat-containing protein
MEITSLMSRVVIVIALLTATAQADVRVGAELNVGVRVAPPAVRVEAIPRAPSPRHVWIAGYWTHSGGRYVWVGGRYVVRPRPGAVWVAARWRPHNGQYVFEPGRWSTGPQAGPEPVVAKAPPPAQPQPTQKEHHAHDIRVGTLHARVLYAHDVHAANWKVGRIVAGRNPGRRGDGRDIRATSLDADVVYAHDVHADRIIAQEIVAEHVDHGR